ncbi:MAG: Gfo/Idh/MocA family oxidoreductase [Rhizobiaceae bacterium]|nr:Gfo/Idh/MocA family oxidoreductase [Rhizobiaceae bacterium]
MTKLAILGAGRMAQVHATALIDANIGVAAIFDINRPASEALAKKLQADVAASAREAVSRKDVDGVLIVTSNDTHMENILLATNANKPVMCEKPLAATLQETLACVDALGAAATKVFLAFNRRFDVNHMALKAAINKGEIGDIEQIVITSRDPCPPPLESIKSSGGLFYEMMIHDLDMARWLLGEEFIRLNANGAALVDPAVGKMGDVDTATVSMEAASGRQVVIINSRRASYGYDQRIEVFGSKGMAISQNPRKSSLVRYSQSLSGNPDGLYDFYLDRYADSYRTELLCFVKHVQEGSDMPVNALDGLRAACLADAAKNSSVENRSIKLDTNGMEVTIS